MSEDVREATRPHAEIVGAILLNMEEACVVFVRECERNLKHIKRMPNSAEKTKTLHALEEAYSEAQEAKTYLGNMRWDHQAKHPYI